VDEDPYFARAMQKMDIPKYQHPPRPARHGKGIQWGNSADGGLCGKTKGKVFCAEFFHREKTMSKSLSVFLRPSLHP
jgi:hypothetical protein